MLTGAFVVGEIAPPIVQAVAQTTDPSLDLVTGAGPDTGQSGGQGQDGGPSGNSTSDHDRSRGDRHY